MNEMFKGIMGVMPQGTAKLSMNGNIAIKTSNGYKTYNLKEKRLTNCNSFVFPDMGEGMFFLMPTNKVRVGDIILNTADNCMKCVVKVLEDTVKVIDYETSKVEELVPERHMFMGNVYFYGKVVSMFGDMTNTKKSSKDIMKYMMMMQMMKGMNNQNFGGANSNMNNMLPMMLMMNNSDFGFGNMFGNMFENMFDMDDEDTDEEKQEVE